MRLKLVLTVNGKKALVKGFLPQGVKSYDVSKLYDIEGRISFETRSFEIVLNRHSKTPFKIVLDDEDSKAVQAFWDLIQEAFASRGSVNINYLNDDSKYQELIDSEELCQFCPCTDFGSIHVNTNQYNLCEGCKCDVAYDYYLDSLEQETEANQMKAKQVIFNGPATVVIWEDNSKTIVKCSEEDMLRGEFDREKGFLVAYFERHSGLTKTQTSKLLKKITEQE